MKFFFLAFLLSGPALAGSPFIIKGDVYTAAGTSGTASTANSYAGVTLLRDQAPGEAALENPGPNSRYPQRIFPAGNRPAYFLTDAGSQWQTALAANQGVLAVIETAPGNNGWDGDAYAVAVSHTVASEDLLSSRMVLPKAYLAPIPAPELKGASGDRIEIQYPRFQDPSGRAASLSLFRRVAGAGNDWAHLGDLKNPDQGPDTYTDQSVTSGTNYEYAMSVNYLLGSGTGAGGNAGIYTTAAKAVSGIFTATRVQPRTAATPAPPPTKVEIDPDKLAGNWAVFPNPATGDIFKVVFKTQGNSDYSIKVHNLLGEKVKEEHGTVKGNATFEESVSISNLSSGVYLVRLELKSEQGETTVFSWKKLAIVK